MTTADVIEQSPVPCPLCEYDLRGLPRDTPPRCPECGASYTWTELIDPAVRRHKFLFEHQTRKQTRALIKTFFAGWRPTKFWSSLHPAQPIHLKRIAVYVIVLSILFPLTFLAGASYDGYLRYKTAVTARNAEIQNILHPPPPPGWLGAIRFDPNIRFKFAGQIIPDNSYIEWNGYASAEDGSQPSGGVIDLDARLDARYAIPTRQSLFRDQIQLLHVYSPDSGLGLLGQTFLLAFSLFPLSIALSVLAMKIFRASMRQAGVKTRHLIRVATYTYDLLAWPGLLLAAAFMARFVRRCYRVKQVRDVPFADLSSTLHLYEVALIGFAIFALLWLIATYRLAIAMRLYLQFRHAPAMAIGVQIIVALAIALMFIWFNQLMA